MLDDSILCLRSFECKIRTLVWRVVFHRSQGITRSISNPIIVMISLHVIFDCATMADVIISISAWTIVVWVMSLQWNVLLSVIVDWEGWSVSSRFHFALFIVFVTVT